MRAHKAIQHLEILLSRPSLALALIEKESFPSAWSVFKQLHLPLCLLYPFAIYLAPYYLLSEAWSWHNVIFPLCCVLILLLFAALYDCLVEYAEPRLYAGEARQHRIRNIALYYHLPLSAASIFFFLHPYIGYCALFASEVFALYCAVEYSAGVHQISRARALLYLFMSILLVLFVCFLLLLFRACVLTYDFFSLSLL